MTTMPIIEESHVQSHAEKQAASVICSEYDDVRDAAQQVEDAKVDALFTRFQWGRAIYNAIKRDGVDTGDVYAEVAKRLDKSESYVSHHKRFAERCVEVYPGYDPSVAGYVAEAQDKDWRLSWNRAVSWISSSSKSDDVNETATELEQMREQVERRKEDHHEAVSEFAEAYMDKKDELQPSEKEQMEGVIVQSKVMIEDTERQLEKDLPEKKQRRVEFDPYTEWVIRHHACVCTGLIDDRVQPHHFRHGAWQQTGGSTKPPDFDVLPLHSSVHDELEDMDYNEFWQKYEVDPIVELHRLKNEWLEKMTRPLR